MKTVAQTNEPVHAQDHEIQTGLSAAELEAVSGGDRDMPKPPPPNRH